MKLTKYQKEGIVRAIMNDVPKPDKSKRHAAVQAAVVKAMSPECRKVYNKTPSALITQHTGYATYDECNYSTQSIVVGDVPKEKVRAILKPYEDEDEAHSKARRQLKAAVDGCSTLKQLETTLPEFKKYFPTEEAPTKNLPALANVVADLSKLGWPKGKQPKENANA